jgi:hypothetical protein
MMKLKANDASGRFINRYSTRTLLGLTTTVALLLVFVSWIGPRLAILLSVPLLPVYVYVVLRIVGVVFRPFAAIASHTLGLFSCTVIIASIAVLIRMGPLGLLLVIFLSGLWFGQAILIECFERGPVSRSRVAVPSVAGGLLVALIGLSVCGLCASGQGGAFGNYCFAGFSGGSADLQWSPYASSRSWTWMYGRGRLVPAHEPVWELLGFAYSHSGKRVRLIVPYWLPGIVLLGALIFSVGPWPHSHSPEGTTRAIGDAKPAHNNRLNPSGGSGGN